jgi:hypothetical protein
VGSCVFGSQLGGFGGQSVESSVDPSVQLHMEEGGFGILLIQKNMTSSPMGKGGGVEWERGGERGGEGERVREERVGRNVAISPVRAVRTVRAQYERSTSAVRA